MVRLKQRADFLATASGTKIVTTGFVLQRRRRGDAGPARVGFTVSRKVGTAVERNRVRRRLREMVRLAGDLESGCDYVLVGRRSALARPFERLGADFRQALGRMPLDRISLDRMPRERNAATRTAPSEPRRRPGAARAELDRKPDDEPIR